MMRKLILISAAMFLLLIACNKESAEKPADKVTVVTLEQLNSGTYEYSGGDVEVEGLCVHVCSHSGKKLFIAGSNPEDKLQIFAAEKLGTFPKELEGSKLKVTGPLVLEKIDMDYANGLESEIQGAEKEGTEHSCEFEDGMKKIDSLKERIKASPKGYLTKYTMTTANYKKM